MAPNGVSLLDKLDVAFYDYNMARLEESKSNHL